MKRFKIQVFIASTIIIGLFLIPSFIAAAAEDEGTMGNSILGTILSNLFYILRFPTHTHLWNIFSGNEVIFFIGLLINCMFYGLIIERIISFFNSRRPFVAHEPEKSL